MTLSPEDFVCPVCKQTDRVEKVSTVYAAGISTGAYSGGTTGIGISSGGAIGVGAAHTNLTSVMQTQLSWRLAPPPRPLPPTAKWRGGTIGLLIFLAFAWLIGFAATAASEITAKGIGIAVILLSIAGTIGLITSMQPERAKKVEYARHVMRWQQARANWERLYYCGRNDIVFLPGVPDACVPAHEIYRLL
jgi:hypothetical protein